MPTLLQLLDAGRRVAAGIDSAEFGRLAAPAPTATPAPPSAAAAAPSPALPTAAAAQPKRRAAAAQPKQQQQQQKRRPAADPELDALLSASLPTALPAMWDEDE